MIDYSIITATLNTKKTVLDNYLERKEWGKAIVVIRELKKDFANLHDFVCEKLEQLP